MKYTIKFLDDKEPLEIEAESFKNAVELAVKNGADMRHADLVGCNMRECDLSGCDMRECDLSHANLAKAT